MESAPRKPPQVSTTRQDAGMRSRVPPSRPVTRNTTALRTSRTTRKAATISRQEAATSASLTWKPINKKTSELSTKAMYSQKDSTTTRVVGFMAERALEEPHSIPATTVAITPEPWAFSLSRKEP